MVVFACGQLPCKGTFDINVEDLTSPTPCGPCLLLHSSHAFENTLAKGWESIANDEEKTQKYMPGIFQNEIQDKIFAQHKGVEKLFKEV